MVSHGWICWLKASCFLSGQNWIPVGQEGQPWWLLELLARGLPFCVEGSTGNRHSQTGIELLVLCVEGQILIWAAAIGPGHLLLPSYWSECCVAGVGAALAAFCPIPEKELQSYLLFRCVHDVLAYIYSVPSNCERMVYGNTVYHYLSLSDCQALPRNNSWYSSNGLLYFNSLIMEENWMFSIRIC